MRDASEGRDVWQGDLDVYAIAELGGQLEGLGPTGRARETYPRDLTILGFEQELSDPSAPRNKRKLGKLQKKNNKI